MKIQTRQIESFVRSPDQKARVILVYGPDRGLMQERTKTLGLSIVSDLNDPFNATTLSMESLQEDPARLQDEASAMSMMGGARLIRITDASDNLTPSLKTYLESPSPENLVLLEAGALGPRSSLRLLCEKAGNAAAIPCYVEEERSLTGLIRQMLQEEGFRIEPDALNWLASNLVGDRARVRSEIEKLILYMGQSTAPVSLIDAQSCCGDTGVRSLDELIYSTFGLDTGKALTIYHGLLQEGVPVIAILRALQNQVRRLHSTQARMKNGENPEQAMKKLAPPVFFKQADAFTRQLHRWPMPTLEKAMRRLAILEAQCKKTGAPIDTLCAQALLSISAKR